MIDQAVTYLQQAKRVLFITGAGISAASGLPTYRGIGGLYNDQLTDNDMPIELALSGMMMGVQPEVTWRYIAQIETACRGATFNRAHQIIAEMEQVFEQVWVLTQNVDGLHRAAGSQAVIDIHGDIYDLYCLSCEHTITVDDYSSLQIPPACPDCQGLMRPNVVLFGELLPQDKVALMHQELRNGFDLLFSIGTTSTFPYIANPIIEASRCNIPTIEINPAATPISDIVTLKFLEGAVEALSAMWNRYQGIEQPTSVDEA